MSDGVQALFLIAAKLLHADIRRSHSLSYGNSVVNVTRNICLVFGSSGMRRKFTIQTVYWPRLLQANKYKIHGVTVRIGIKSIYHH